MHTIPTIPTFRGWMQTDMRNQRRPQWSLESSFVFLDGLETIEDLGKVVLANRGFDKRGLGLERMGLEATGTTSVWGKNKSFGKLRCVGIRQSKRNLEKDCRVCMLCSCNSFIWNIVLDHNIWKAYLIRTLGLEIIRMQTKNLFWGIKTTYLQ